MDQDQTPHPCDAFKACEPVFVARQPIFDRASDVWGYELLFRHGGDAETARIDDPDAATSRVIADGYLLARPGIPEQQPMLVNFTRNMLLSGAALMLPSESCMVEILETVMPDEAVLQACADLKAAGYRLALDDFVGQPEHAPFLKLADVVKVDVMGQEPAAVLRLYKMLRGAVPTLLAEKVETRQMYELTRKLGFNLFQGFFFHRPELIAGRKVSASEAAKLMLLQKLGNPDYTVDDIAALIGSDLSLSYRLMRYINSARFCLMKTIDSIRQAVVLLGHRQLSSWLRVVIMSDLSPNRVARELAFAAAVRARFLEQVAVKVDKGLPAEPFFLLGLFSLLDAIMGQPMGELLEGLSLLDNDLRRALLGQESPYSEWLEAVHAIERGAWEQLSAFLAGHGLDPMVAAMLHADATTWAGEIVGLTPA